MLVGQRNNIVGKVLSLLAANTGWISSTPCNPLSPAKDNHRAQHKKQILSIAKKHNTTTTTNKEVSANLFILGIMIDRAIYNQVACVPNPYSPP